MTIPLAPVLQLPSDAQTVRWGELYGSGPAYFLAEAAVAAVAPLLVVASSGREADQYLSELRFFTARSGWPLVVPGSRNSRL